MKHVARLSLTVLALAASAVVASPAFANHGGAHRQLIALHGEGHWENGNGPRAAARWVFTPAGENSQTKQVAMHKVAFATHKAG